MASPNTPSWGLSPMPVVCLDPLSHGVPRKSSSRSEAWSTSGWRLAHHQPACTLPGAQAGGHAEEGQARMQSKGRLAGGPGTRVPVSEAPSSVLSERSQNKGGPAEPSLPHSTHSRLWENSSLLTLLPTGYVQVVFDLSLRARESLAVSPWATHSDHGGSGLWRKSTSQGTLGQGPSHCF